ncbi:superoxide dismutase [Virgibacillus senegalensis]|uniref:superoxide dismutase n=1 Tax=Virgibacillus senegalensis TaxID=1499679 RepID=UPI00069F49E3|nr:superoxide dismutase [Virgibacillus senegalensis]
MNEKKKQYLSSLKNWGQEIEEKMGSVKLDEKDSEEWKKQLIDWKALLNTLLEEKEEPTDEKIELVEEKSVKLFHLIKYLMEKPRQRPDVIQPGQHKLPDLPYPYNALEPYISERIMRLHHDRHHRSYVDGLNKAEQELYTKKPDSDLIKHWMRQQAFNGSGHFLHSLFWENMSPRGGGRPSGRLLRQIEQDFGSFDAFKSLFSKAAESVEGVGWAALVWEPRSGRLAIQTIEKHQMFSLWDVIPLLVLDVWEHAYYLQYENKRADYVNNWWNIVNWQSVSRRLETARQLNFPLV